MANVTDYMDWRGDIPLTSSPFNEIDNYLCSMLSYPNFSEVLPADGYIPLKEAMSRYVALYGDKGNTLGASNSVNTVPVVLQMAQTERFGSLYIGNYINQYDEKRTEQFSAITIALPDGTRFLSFRGTDDTLVSWKEDLLMAASDVVPAQTSALAYLCSLSERFSGKLILGGHSKGGNLAVYAAVNAPEEVQSRILSVQSNDGPGFRYDITQQPGYDNIASKIHVLMPQRSIVGTLLDQGGETRVVRCSNALARGHDGYFWQLKGPNFLYAGELSMASRALHDAANDVVTAMTDEEILSFVDSLFSFLKRSGAETFSDLTALKLNELFSLVKDAQPSPAVKKFLTTIVSAMAKEYAEELRESLTDVSELKLFKKTEEDWPEE